MLKPKVTLLILSCLATVYCFAQTPAANFTSDITSGCSPIVVNFTDQSTGNPTSWKWDFGNGATSTLKNPSATYFDPGTYTVTLTATNANGTNTVTKSAYIKVFTEPVANFTSDKLTNCAPARIQFTDQSATPAGTTITSWKWDFGDGGTATGSQATYVYKNVGSYTVTLTITNDKGCKKLITKPNYINVTTGVKPDFSFSDPGVCSAPATVNFTNTSSGPGNLSYSWNFGNNNTSTSKDASQYYATNGTYKVRLTVASDQGCLDSMVREVIVGKANTDFNIPASICPKVPATFTNNSTPRPIRSRWDFGNGKTDTLRNGSTIFATGGTYTVTLINTYTACTDTLTKTVNVLNAPPLNFSASDTAGCKTPYTTTFSGPAGAQSYLWDFGDSTTSTQANPAHTYNVYGVFNVRLIVRNSNGCMDTLTKNNYIVVRKPVISFPELPVGGCAPFTLTFKSTVQSVEPVTGYSWNFGDTAGTSTLKEPTYTYTRFGNYTITLTVTTNSGCTETFSLPGGVKTGPKPTAAFTSNLTTACANPGIQFINQSTGATTYEWTFSDGSSSTVKDPLHTFKDTGSIDVTLYAINNGCRDTLLKRNYAFIQPSVSRFDYRPDCNNPLVYTFTDKSVGATTWSWDFGDNTTFTGKTPPPHTFPAYGTYQVKLVTSNGSCTYTLVRTVTIADNRPDFTASTESGCKALFVTFNNAQLNGELIKKYHWNVGEGTTDTTGGVHKQHLYTTPGTYSVSLIGIDTFGCQHIRTKTDLIKVNGPTAFFNSTTNAGCKGMTVTFIDSTQTYNNSAIVSWTFDFGDGTTQTFTAPPFTHVYDSVGDYDVKMIVTDALGCRDSVLRRGFVSVSTLKAAWRFENQGQTCPGTLQAFINRTESDLPHTSLWVFSDNTTSTDYHAYKAFSDTGYYSATLYVEDIVGCRDSLTKIDSLYVGLPKANFDANNFTTYCTPFEARFTNTSYFGQSYMWDLGAGKGTSNQENPVTYYTTTGVYDIKLVTTSPGGCKDSITKKLTVYNPQDATISYSPLNGCTPRTVNFEAFSPMNGRFIWDFGDGNVVDTTTNVMEHRYLDFGSFLPRIILKEPSGACIVPLLGTDTIRMLGIKPKFFIDTLLLCDAGTVNITDSTTTNDPALSYNWDMGDGTTYSTASNFQHRYDTTGTYYVKLLVTSANGCIDSLTRGPVRVVQTPFFDITSDSVFCAKDFINHSAALKVADTSSVSWQWKFPNGNTSTSQNPVAQQYPAGGNYVVEAISKSTNGCSDTVRQNILVHSLPKIDLPATIVKMVGVPLTIPAKYGSGVVSYNWAPASNLDCTDCPQPVTVTKFPAKYTVTATDSNSCNNSATIQVMVLCKGATIFVPNTFSPNGDGNNDVLYVRGTGLDRVKSFRIFNRWGEMVFEKRDFPSNNAAYGWNGSYRGQPIQPDVYIYQAEVYCENGEIIRFEGNIALIK